MANGITCIRILCSFALLLCPVLSIPFYVLYLLAGFTDMIDGTVARKTNSVSEFGSQLDTLADFVLVVVCSIKLIPIMELDSWLYFWIATIAVIKVGNFVFGFLMQKKFVAVHSVMNKATGALLFALPLTLALIDLNFSAAVVCAVATCAAIQEGHSIGTGRMEDKIWKTNPSYKIIRK